VQASPRPGDDQSGGLLELYDATVGPVYAYLALRCGSGVTADLRLARGVSMTGSHTTELTRERTTATPGLRLPEPDDVVPATITPYLAVDSFI
jgi:hypothetical protein